VLLIKRTKTDSVQGYLMEGDTTLLSKKWSLKSTTDWKWMDWQYRTQAGDAVW